MNPTTPPAERKSGWQPTVSTSAGALVGGAVAQLICATIPDLVHHPLADATVGSIYTLCIALAGYLFPDGGRK